MIETVARAICTAEKMNEDDPLGGWIHWVGAAEAALRAMRKPTAKMLRAASAAMSPGKRPTTSRVGCKAKHGIRYRAMIDAALKD